MLCWTSGSKQVCLLSALLYIVVIKTINRLGFYGLKVFYLVGLLITRCHSDHKQPELPRTVWVVLSKAQFSCMTRLLSAIWFQMIYRCYFLAITTVIAFWQLTFTLARIGSSLGFLLRLVLLPALALLYTTSISLSLLLPHDAGLCIGDIGDIGGLHTARMLVNTNE